jgi:hypothetical protein
MNQPQKIYERVDDRVYSRNFGSEPSTRTLEYVTTTSTSDWTRFALIVSEIARVSKNES